MDSIVMSSVYGESDSLVAAISTPAFLICCAASIILGLVCALVYMFRHSYSKSFVVTIALLPLIVQMVITLVNGNLGAGIAVMGVFNLVRFRSIPGSAKDIGTVFFAMAIGLATGMGFIGLAVLFTVIVSAANIVYVLTGFGSREKNKTLTLRITAPEDIESEHVFDDVLAAHASEWKMTGVETANMGSLYKLEYSVKMAGDADIKGLIDGLRSRNGNLKISCLTAPDDSNRL